MAITVWAANPHFVRCSASGVNSNGTLDVCFKIAGLGRGQTLMVTASAQADAVYACQNHGAPCPNAANTVEVQTDVSATVTLPPCNGHITACLTVDPPPPTNLTCPPGQDLVLVSISYTNVSVSAPGVGNCNTSPGTFAANFFPNCP
jgi:hypothetical protein